MSSILGGDGDDLNGDRLAERAVAKAYAICAGLARAEATSQTEIARQLDINPLYHNLAEGHRRAAKSAERIARAIERGER